MIPFLSDTPAPSGVFLPMPMAGGESSSGTAGAARDFAGLLGAALSPEPRAGAAIDTAALPAAAPEASVLSGAATPALVLPSLHSADPGKGLPLPGADLPPPVSDGTPEAPTLSVPAGANATRALLTRDAMVITAPRAVVPVEWLQEGARPGVAPGAPETVGLSAPDAVADTAASSPIPSAPAPAPAAPVLPDDPLFPADAPALATEPLPVAASEPVVDASEDGSAETNTSPPAPASAPLPSPIIASTLAVVATPTPAPLAVAVPPSSGTVEVQSRPLPLARNAAAPVRAATPSATAPASSAPADDAPAPAIPSAATPIEALAEAPAQSAPAPAQQSPAPTLAAAPPMPAAAPERGEAVRAAPPAVQLEQAIDQVGTLREAMRTARPEMTLRHAEFGFVSLRLEQPAPEQWRAVLASRDPGFVPAIQLALAERAVAATADSAASTGHHGGSQNGTGDQRYGASPNGGQGGSQPYLGQSGQRDGEAAPDHRRPSTAATLSARAEEEGEAAASPGHHARGTFA